MVNTLSKQPVATGQSKIPSCIKQEGITILPNDKKLPIPDHLHERWIRRILAMFFCFS